MGNFAIEEKIAKLRSKIKMYERHAVHRKIGEANAEIARLEGLLKKQAEKEVSLADVEHLAPKPAAQARKAAGTTKASKPAARRTPAAVKSTTDEAEKDKT